MTNNSLRAAFLSPILMPVRIGSMGFTPVSKNQEQNAGPPIDKLEGRVLKMTALRNRYQRNVVTCSSPDGTRSTNGVLCADCLHPDCRLKLKAHLRDGLLLYVLYLNVPSANNLLDLDDEAKYQGEDLCQWRLRLTTRTHGSWTEVIFRRIP